MQRVRSAVWWHTIARHKATWGRVSVVTSCPHPHVIAVEASSRLVVGHGMPSRERVGDWAGKEEVSKEERKRKSTSRRVNQCTAQRQGMLRDLAKKKQNWGQIKHNST